MFNLKRCAGLILACITLSMLTGCANMKMSAPVATIENTVKLRSDALAPANVGAFTPAPGKIAGLDHGISVRGNPLASSVEDSFTQYLRETIKVELVAAGLYDAKADTIISGMLTDSDLDAAMSQGTGMLSARFIVIRSGAERYNRELTVKSNWESSFMGAVAIPAAGREYQALYRKLVTSLLDDPEFRRAISRN